jgi:hypothetical protein
MSQLLVVGGPEMLPIILAIGAVVAAGAIGSVVGRLTGKNKDKDKPS